MLERIRLWRYALLAPGVGWAAILIGAELNPAEGWWLVAVTGGTAVIVMIREIRGLGDRCLPAFITFAVVAAASAFFLGTSDVVIFMQGTLLILFAVSASPSVARGTRVALLIAASLDAAALSLMLLAAWGMAH
jgi:hypothetical protein